MVKDTERARITVHVKAGDRDNLLEVLRALADFPDRHAARLAADTALLAYIDDGRISEAYARLHGE